MRNSFSKMLSYAAALQCVETWAKKSSRPSCVVPLTQAVGRITATAIFACSNRPETDVSAMDGYAFAHAAMASAPEGLRIQGLTVAGAQPVALPEGYAQVQVCRKGQTALWLWSVWYKLQILNV